MTNLQVLLHVAAQSEEVYELHSLDFYTAFLLGSLYEEVWLCRPSAFTGTFPPGTQWRLRRPVYDPSLFVRRGSTPFFVLAYVDDLVFATADRVSLADVKSELQKRHTCTDLGEQRHYLGLQITRDRAARTITLSLSHMVQQVRQRVAKYLATTSGVGLVLRGTQPVVLTGHCDSSYAVDDETHMSTQGYCFSQSSRAISWRSMRSSSVLTSTAEAEIYAGAIAAQELRWLTFLLIDLGERPSSAPTLFTNNKATILFCQETRLETWFPSVTQEERRFPCGRM
ncbi:unnamed protein product [Closterium sp. NIES-53]